MPGRDPGVVVALSMDGKSRAWPDATPFSDLLRRHRRASGISQEALAERARISAAAVGALERGDRRAPYRETVTLLADALHLLGTDRATFEAAAERNRGRRTRGEELPAPRNNLPAQLTSFVGRDDEIAAMKKLLATHRLVTLTGFGGVGKTRTAIEAAKQLLGERREETWFVDLSPLPEGRLAASTIGTVLDITVGESADPVTSLVLGLRTRKMLLLLDNCEHIIDQTAELVSTILRECPNITILATSRERLALGNEHVYRLSSLPIPPENPKTPEEAFTYASFRLFIDRASAIDAHLQLNAERLRMTAEICRRLEGIPLALELVATRLPTLGFSILNQRLREHFGIESGTRDLPNRQQTMFATVTWSYDLLGERERKLLRRMAVFRGGVLFEAAEAIGADCAAPSGTASDLLSSLVDKSFLVLTASEDATRFGMLETVRSFALQKLNECDEFAEAAQAQLQWIASFADQAEQRYRQIPLAQWFTEVGVEIDNFRSGLDWALKSGSDNNLVLAARILIGSRYFWSLTVRLREFRRWLEAVLVHIDATRHPHLASHLVSIQIWFSGPDGLAIAARTLPMLERYLDRKKLIVTHLFIAFEYGVQQAVDEAERAISRAFALFEDDPEHDSNLLVQLLETRCGIRTRAGRTTEARTDLAEARRHADPLGMNNLHTGTQLHWEAGIEFAEGNMARAGALFEEAAEQQRAQSTSPAIVLCDLASARLVLGDVAGATAAVREALGLLRSDPENAWLAIWHLAAIAAIRGEPERAARLIGFAKAEFARRNRPPDFIEQASGEIREAFLAKQLSSDAVAMLEAVGSKLAADEAVAEGLEVLAQIEDGQTRTV